MEQVPPPPTEAEIARQLEAIQHQLAALAADWNNEHVADDLNTIRGHLRDLARDNAELLRHLRR